MAKKTAQTKRKAKAPRKKATTSTRSAKKKPARRKTSSATKAEDERHRLNKLEATAHSQDLYFSPIGEKILKGPADVARRKRCADDFVDFCKTYGEKAFALPWSEYHLRAAAKIESAAKQGSSFSFAMPRGSGKTTLCHWAMIWATLNGHARYAIYVGATAAAASRRLGSIKKTLRFNELLFDDFPEIIGPIRFCKGEARRAGGQKWKGESTGIEFGAEKIVFATLQDTSELPWLADVKPTGNSIIDLASIDGEIRGRNFERQDGETARPDFAVADDPQTRESAKSPNACNYRESILKGDVKFLAGPERPIGLVVPCTVIYEDDLADRLLDPDRNPEFQGERARMVEKFPDEETEAGKAWLALWERYDEIRRSDLRSGDSTLKKATAFYSENREPMDRGIVVSWKARFSAHELSAIQHAMNLKLSDEASFWAEGQNEPQTDNGTEAAPLTAQEVEAKTIGVRRRIVPEDSDFLTAYVDISEKCLWWTVVAWRKKDFTGTVIDYGVFPEQRSQYVTLGSIRKTLRTWRKGGEDFSAVLISGLDELVNSLVETEYKSESGEIFTIQAAAIDSSWGEYTFDVYRFCRRSKYASILRPAKGVGVTATKKPLVDPEAKTKSREDVVGQWRFSKTKIGTFLLQYDTNFWKTKVSNLLRASIGAPGALTLCKTHGAENHRMIAEQLTAEKPSTVSASNGRTVTQWELIPGRDNHFLDCVTGSAVLARTLGAEFPIARRSLAQSKDGKTQDAPEGAKRIASKKKSGSGPVPGSGRKKRRKYNVNF